MTQKYVEAINAGQIMSVDWHSIEEMLGEDAERTHLLPSMQTTALFRPKERRTPTSSQRSRLPRFSSRPMSDSWPRPTKTGFPIFP